MAQILLSKLSSPSVESLLPRPHLEENIATGPKVVSVVAGAGFGKSSLVSGALFRWGGPSLWLRLDELDRDVVTLVAYLLRGVEMALGEELSCSASDWRGRLLLLLARLEKAKWQGVLVLDDLHRVHESVEVQEALNFMLQRLPDGVRVVLVSRETPKLKLSGFRMEGRLLEMEEGDLRFSEEELAGLFALRFEGDLDAELSHHLAKASQGWVAAVMLLFYGLDRQDSKKALSAKLSGASDHIFSYLEEQVFEGLPAETQLFLIQTSIFPFLDGPFCNAVLGSDSALEILRRLEDRHLLTFSLDPGRTRFAYHHLWQGFLESKLEETMPPLERMALHGRVGKELAEIDSPLAISHLLKAQCLDEAMVLLSGVYDGYFFEGRLEVLAHFLGLVSEETVSKTPLLQLISGRLDSCNGLPEEAREKFFKALKLFRGVSDSEGEMVCLTHLAYQYYYTGNVREARAFLFQVLPEIPQNSLSGALAWTFVILFSAICGEMEEAESYIQRAEEFMESFDGGSRVVGTAFVDSARFFYLYCKGEFAASSALTEAVLRVAETHELDYCQPISWYQCAVNGFYVQAYREGISWAEKGILISEKMGLKDSQLGWLYLARAQNHLGLGRLDEAETDARQAMGIFEVPGNRWGMASVLEFEAMLALEKEDATGALARIKRGEELISGHGLSVTEGLLMLRKAQALALAHGETEALTLLPTIETRLAHAPHWLAEALLLKMRCFVALGETPGEVLEEVVKLSLSTGYLRPMVSSIGFLVPSICSLDVSLLKPLLQKLLETWPHLPWRAMLGGPVQGDVAELFASLPEPPIPPLSITLLGPFSLHIGEEEVPAEAWTNTKAQMLLKLLAAKSQAGFISRDLLCECLWPGEDPSKTHKRFNVAISFLRSLFEGRQGHGRGHSSYILKQGEGYRLWTGEGGTIDHAAFLLGLSEIHAGKDLSLSHLLDLESLWRGEFLEETPYEAWIVEEKASLQREYLYLLGLLVDRYEAMEDPVTALVFAQKALQADPYAEPLYRRTMRLCFQLGDNPGVQRLYNQCLSRMDEMGCPLHPKTSALYSELFDQ